jgi:hypothetical protein
VSLQHTSFILAQWHIRLHVLALQRITAVFATVCRSYRSFEQSWKSLQQHAQVTKAFTTTLVCDRIWCNKARNPSRQNAASIWRPVAPPGYTAVGDCLVTGSWAAPTSVTVLREDRDDRQPLVVPARVSHLCCAACTAYTSCIAKNLYSAGVSVKRPLSFSLETCS